MPASQQSALSWKAVEDAVTGAVAVASDDWYDGPLAHGVAYRGALLRRLEAAVTCITGGWGAGCPEGSGRLTARFKDDADFGGHVYDRCCIGRFTAVGETAGSSGVVASPAGHRGWLEERFVGCIVDRAVSKRHQQEDSDNAAAPVSHVDLRFFVAPKRYLRRQVSAENGVPQLVSWTENAENTGERAVLGVDLDPAQRMLRCGEFKSGEFMCGLVCALDGADGAATAMLAGGATETVPSGWLNRTADATTLLSERGYPTGCSLLTLTDAGSIALAERKHSKLQRPVDVASEGWQVPHCVCRAASSCCLRSLSVYTNTCPQHL